MKIDTILPNTSLKNVAAIARAAEEIGFSALWSAETQHDPFLPGPLVAETTSKLFFGTAIAVSFARSPATLAYISWDLADASGGRFILGLGTQVKPHIERRFGLAWPDSPIGKLREQIQAIKAFWNSWQTGDRLNFRGKYYKLTLMTPFFNPGPIDNPHIPIFIAGVNSGLAQLAGEIADGFHVHPLHSRKYLAEVIKPAIDQGTKKAHRPSDDCKISTPVFIITNDREKQDVRRQISFYASTPSYRQVFSIHGWEETARDLSHLASRGRWDEMPSLITDEMLSSFAVISDQDSLASRLLERYAGLAHRLTPYFPFVPKERDHFWHALTAAFK
jgi:probable F420-dependent oxidoreductase